MGMTFKPKKQQIHVPGYGVVQKEDFNQKHFNALMTRAGDNRDKFIKQHFDVVSYGDQPLFAEAEKEKETPAPVVLPEEEVEAPEETGVEPDSEEKAQPKKRKKRTSAKGE